MIKPKLLIILPAFNEENKIGVVLRRALKIKNARIIVIDDGSTDKTGKIIMRVIINNGELLDITHIENSVNMGKSYCIKVALKMLSDEDIVLFCDTDDQYNILEYKKLLKPILENKADYVIGKRDFSNIPFRNGLGNKVWRFIFNALYGTNLEDTNCGFVAMKADVANRTVIKSNRYSIDNEMMIQALENGYKLTNASVSIKYHKERGIKEGVRIVAGVSWFMIKRKVIQWLENPMKK